MMTKINLYEFRDLLFHATSVGYGWDEAHELLVDDRVPPMHELNKRNFYKEKLEELGYSNDSILILETFFDTKSIKKFTLIK